MKLNREMWLTEVKRVERELREHKKAMHEPGFKGSHTWYQKLYGLRADATRLYALRRDCKGKQLEIKRNAWYWTFPTYWKKPCLSLFWSCFYRPEEVNRKLIDLVPGWRDQFILPSAPVEGLPSGTEGEKAVQPS